MAAIRLARDYHCRDGAPVVHSVDPTIFSARYFKNCMACGFCKDQCCDHGVDVDLRNAENLRNLGPAFAARVATPAAEWFTSETVPDAEFPSGAHVRTRVRDGKCVFAIRGGRGCAIHAHCLEEGIDYHLLKPMISTLFPVTFEHGVLVPSDEARDGSLVCSGEGASLYDGVREELRYYFGDALVAELDALNRLQF